MNPSYDSNTVQGVWELVMCTAYVSVCIWRRCNNTQIVVYICWRVVCEAWTSQANTNVSNGSRVDASKLELCQRACFSNSECDGLDWVHNAADGQRCWLSGPWSGTRNIGTASGAVTHYDFNRNCHTQGNHWRASCPISLPCLKTSIYIVFQKTSHWMFDNNFGKCGPIFKILSPGDS